MSVDTLAASADLINTVETKLKEVQHNQDTQENSRGLGRSKINCRIAARVILSILNPSRDDPVTERLVFRSQ